MFCHSGTSFKSLKILVMCLNSFPCVAVKDKSWKRVIKLDVLKKDVTIVPSLVS